jgi:CheY-like chemotaxis protein
MGAAQAGRQGQSAAGDRSRPRAVLIVDDDPFIRRLIATTLEDVTNFVLHEAQDGIRALEIATREHPALVFLDVDMPRLDGIETCRRLRLAPSSSQATIVMLTAAHGREVELRAERAGADLFLTKPFSPLELLRLVDRLDSQ